MGANQATPNMELNLKLERIYGLLTQCDLDALLLQKTQNFTWATCVGDSHINIADSIGIASLLITRTNRFVMTKNAEDTILVGEESNEIITEMTDWPSIDVRVGDQVIQRPAILEK